MYDPAYESQLYVPSLSLLYTRIPHDDPIDSQSQHTHSHEERTLPAAALHSQSPPFTMDIPGQK